MDDERPYADLSDLSLMATYEHYEAEPDNPETAMLLAEIRRRGLPLRGDQPFPEEPGDPEADALPAGNEPRELDG